MKKNIMLLLLLFSILIFTGMWAETRAQEDGKDLVSVSPMISYQGMLMDSGSNPVNGLVNMTFSLYDNSTGVYLFSWDEIPGNDSLTLIDFLNQNYNINWVKTAKIEKIDINKTIKVSLENNYTTLSLNNENTKVTLQIDDGRTDEFIAKSMYTKLSIFNRGNPLWSETKNVSVGKGIFNTQLGDVNPLNVTQFDQTLWLEISVGTEILTPRQQLLGVPYAFSLIPGAEIIGNVQIPGLTVENRGYYATGLLGIGAGAGVVGRSDSGNGVHGYSNNGSGVYGYSKNIIGLEGRSDNGNGVVGWSDIAVAVLGMSENGYGVAGNSINSSGVVGTGGMVGVKGISDKGDGVWGAGKNGVRGSGMIGGYGGFFSSGSDDNDIVLGGNIGQINTNGWNSNLVLSSHNDVVIKLDKDNDGVGVFSIADSTANILTLDNNGILRLISPTTGATVVEMGEGLDYAEGFNVTDKNRISPGNVLIIDPENPGKLTLSDKAYDTRVAGIVAGANNLSSAVRLGADQFDYDVALAGRVYANVDATYGDVSPGDLLTTSPTPGYAMAVKDYAKAQGAILGKAMERLPKGKKGQILVLVTLQ